MMLEIERATDKALGDALEGVYLSYQNKLLRENYVSDPKVLFLNSKRCFILHVRPTYQLTSSNLKLTVKFGKKTYYAPELYLLFDNKNLNQKSFKYSGEYDFTKRIVERFRSSEKCADYEKENVNCTSKWNCVDWCIIRKFKEKYNKTLFKTQNHPVLVDRDWFSSTEWNTFNPIEISSSNLKVYENITEKCLKEVPNEKACVEIEFQETLKIDSMPDKQTKEIDLQLEIFRSVEECPSFYKFVLDLVSIQGIFFGLTVLKLLTMVKSFKEKLRPGNGKIDRFLIYLLCFLGGGWHT